LSKLKETLQKLAAKPAWFDDEEFMVDDYAGGNMDDAYQGGVRDGRVELARELLAILNEDNN
jgi:hypothetical protein